MARDIKNQKSQLAKLLATENITVQHKPGAKTACFDVKNRVLTLPVWKQMSDDLYDMLVVHEVGHALNTPADGWIEAINKLAAKALPKNPERAMASAKDFLNVVEDVRNDKLQMRRYPGSKRNYVVGYRELIRDGFFGTDVEWNINKKPFIDRMNLRFKGGSIMNIKFRNEEKVFLDRAEKLETWDEVVQLADDIFEYSKAKGPVFWQKPEEDAEEDRFDEKMLIDEDQIINKEEYEAEKKKKEEELIARPQIDTGAEEGEGEETEGQEGEQSSEGQEGEQADAGEEGDASDEDSSEGDAQGEGEEGEDQASKIEGGSSESASNESYDGTDAEASEVDENYVPESETEQAWAKTQNALVEGGGPTEIYYITPGKLIDIRNNLDDYKVVMAEQLFELKRLQSTNITYGDTWLAAIRTSLRKFKLDEATSIGYMAKEFEMKKRANEFRRTAIAKTGRLNTNKLFSYKFNDDLFKRTETVDEGKNHGFVIFLDWSSSMNGHIRKTIMQLLQIAWFCKRVQIPFEVYIFRTPNKNATRLQRVWEDEPMSLDMSDFKVRNILSSRMSLNEFNVACELLWLTSTNFQFTCDPRQMTPLNETISIAPQIVQAFQKRTKVQITNVVFLTDGGASSGQHASLPRGEGWLPGSNYVLQDKEHKHEYELVNKITDQYSTRSFTFNANTRSITEALLERLKDITGCNLFGFFIMGEKADFFKQEIAAGQHKVDHKSRLVRKMLRKTHSSKFENYDDMRNQFRKEGFVEVPQRMGYDEYYLINTSIFSGKDVEMGVEHTMSAKKIAKSFDDFLSNKKSNRMLLREFVSKIVA